MRLVRSCRVKVAIMERGLKESNGLHNFFFMDKEVELCSFADVPDVVIVGMELFYSENKMIFEKISTYSKNSKPKILVIADAESYPGSRMVPFSADKYLVRPINFSDLKSEILKISIHEAQVFSDVSRIKSLVRSLGMPANLLGYRYTVECVEYMIKKSKFTQFNAIYEHVSKNNDTSPECVETSLRNAVKRVVKINNQTFKNIFNLAPGASLSNSLFLSTLKEIFLEIHYSSVGG